MRAITIGGFSLAETGLTVVGRPTFAGWQAAGDYIRCVHKASGWWLADWIVYGDSRLEWKELIDAEMGIDQLTDQTVREYRYVANAIPASSRLDGVSFALHQVCASLTPKQQRKLLAQAKDEGWTLQDMRRAVRAEKQRGVLSGQAELTGMYHVVYADPPWLYADSGVINEGDNYGRAERHYPGMTIDELCKIPVAAHARENAVLFLWVTSPMLSACWPVIEAWGFTYKTSIVWDKMLHNFGHYVSVRHELLLICTRGSCLPDRPVPMPDSVRPVRRSDVHSEKPPEFRALVEQLYDGPYVELFARRQIKGWTTYGNQILEDVAAAV
jgi:N6-adenosine-specific RNA methylase IME4